MTTAHDFLPHSSALSPASQPDHSVDAIIVGAGPAGLFCAHEAAKRGVRVLIIDKQDHAGRKLSMAGGGMGNFTNRHLGPEHYTGENPDFTRFSLRAFNNEAALTLLDTLNIPWEEREFGQIFALRPASVFTETLQQRARELGVDFRFGKKPKIVRHSSSAQALFHVQLDHECFAAPQLVLATGSPAWPQCGADDSGASLAARWGHRLIPFVPALAPFIMPRDWLLLGLEGISLNACITVESKSGPSRDPWPIRPLLFTHKGLSGPAALVASCFYHPGDALLINFLPHLSLLDLLHQPENGKLLFRNLLSRHMPQRLAELLAPASLASRKCAELSKADRLALASAVHAHSVTPTSTETMRKAEVARGGIATDELTSTLQSRLVPHLFFCGEILDVTGLLGGYNIHWALASARVVAKELVGHASLASTKKAEFTQHATQG